MGLRCDHANVRSGLQLSWAWPCIVTTEAATGGPSMLYLVLKSLVSCTNAIGPPLECTKQKITLKLYSSLELELTVTLQQSSETSKPILLLLYLRIYICIIFRPVLRALGQDRRDVSPAQQRAPRPHQPAPARQPHPPPAQPQRQARQVIKVGEDPYWGLLFVLFA